MEKTALDSISDEIITGKRIKRKSESQVLLVYIKIAITQL